MIPLRPFFFVCGLITVAPAWANDEAAAEGLPFADKLNACAACHGENGAKPILPEYPVLAGQHANYLANALGDYRNGRRSNPIMAAQVQALQLSDGDINQLAEFFSKQTSGLTILDKK
ncbi:MAG: c-type cytochrome [Gammaproteobacteria bacterium]|nr:c-type cytochrome [Gammaproteobacteria bacterium]